MTLNFWFPWLYLLNVCWAYVLLGSKSRLCIWYASTLPAELYPSPSSRILDVKFWKIFCSWLMLCQVFWFAMISPLSVFVRKLHFLHRIEQKSFSVCCKNYKIKCDCDIYLMAIIPDWIKANFWARYFMWYPKRLPWKQQIPLLGAYYTKMAGLFKSGFEQGCRERHLQATYG